jgi:hypothetical protein
MMGVSYCDVTATNSEPELVNYLLDPVTPTGTIEHMIELYTNRGKVDSRFEVRNKLIIQYYCSTE